MFGVRAHDYGRNTIEVLFEKISKDGWSNIQLAYQKAVTDIQNFDEITPEILDLTKKSLKKNNLFVSVFGCYIEPSFVDEKLRKENVDIFIRSIKKAKAIDSLCIGTETTNMDKQPNVSRNDAIKSLKKSLYEILQVAEDENVIVGIEPVFYHAMSTPEITQDILKTMGSKNLKIIFDPVNLLSIPEVENQNALWERSMSAFSDEIVAVHLKGINIIDNKIVNVPFEESIINYDFIFDLLKNLKRDIPILREEINLENAKKDLEFLKRGLENF